MIYRGTIRGGVVVLQPGTELPDGMDVIVQPVQAEPAQTSPDRWSSTMRNGVPVFPKSDSECVPGLDLVNRLRDETP